MKMGEMPALMGLVGLPHASPYTQECLTPLSP